MRSIDKPDLKLSEAQQRLLRHMERDRYELFLYRANVRSRFNLVKDGCVPMTIPRNIPYDLAARGVLEAIPQDMHHHRVRYVLTQLGFRLARQYQLM